MHVEKVSSLYLITPEWRDQMANETPGAIGGKDFTSFLKQLETALNAGIDLVQLRAKSLDVVCYDALTAAVRDVCRGRATLILNGPTADGADRPGTGVRAGGIHLSSARLMACRQRPAARAYLVSAACHTLAELQQAARVGADFVTLSPVLPTRSHPGAPPLGWERFADLVAASSVPVYALGGMTRAHLATAQACGARGIAAISGLW